MWLPRLAKFSKVIHSYFCIITIITKVTDNLNKYKALVLDNMEGNQFSLYFRFTYLSRKYVGPILSVKVHTLEDFLMIFFTIKSYFCNCKYYKEYLFLLFRDESSDDELSDGEINKLMIVTPMRPKKHEGFDRTGDFCSRVKMSQDLAQVINDGLKYYEDVSSVVYKLKFYILFMKQD